MRSSAPGRIGRADGGTSPRSRRPRLRRAAPGSSRRRRAPRRGTSSDGLEREARQAEQVAEHAQHLPRRPRVAARLDDAVEALHAAFGVDEGARRLGERRDRQQHVGDVVRRGLNGAQRDDHLGAGRARRARAAPSAASSAGSMFSSRHALSGAPAPSICAGVQAACAGQRADELRADGVAAVGELAEGRAGLLADPARQALRARRCRDAARRRCRAARPCARRSPARRRSPSPRRSAFALSRARRRPWLRRSRRRRRPAPATQLRSARRRCSAHRHQPVVAQGVHAHHLRALARRLAHALREQRMVLAQERADDQRRAAASDSEAIERAEPARSPSRLANARSRRR